MSTRTLPRQVLRPVIAYPQSGQSRCRRAIQRGIVTSTIPRIPKPTPFVPDVPTFLTLIGRNLSQHADKISSWNDLFSLTTSQFRDLGVEPPRSRRYLLRWLDRFRNGQFGLGGEAKFVAGGKAECRLVELKLEGNAPGRTAEAFRSGSIPKTPRKVRRILNVPYSGAAEEAANADRQESVGADGPEQSSRSPAAALRLTPPLDRSILKQATNIEGVRYNPGHGIAGSHVRPVKGTQGSVAVIQVTEGMWEHRRGQKVDGGERRKAEVRAKRRAAERKVGRA